MDMPVINTQSNKYKLITSNTIVFFREHGVDIALDHMKILVRVELDLTKPAQCNTTIDEELHSICYNITGNIDIYPNSFRTTYPIQVASSNDSILYISWFLSRTSHDNDFYQFTYSVTADETPSTSNSNIEDEDDEDQDSEFLDLLDSHFNRLSHLVEPINSHISKKWNKNIYVDEFDELKHSVIMNDSSRDNGDFGINMLLIVPKQLITSLSDSHEFNAWFDDNGVEVSPATELWLNYDIKPEHTFDDIIKLMDEDLAWIWFVKDEE